MRLIRFKIADKSQNTDSGENKKKRNKKEKTIIQQSADKALMIGPSLKKNRFVHSHPRRGVKSKIYPPYPQCVVKDEKWGGFSE